MNKFKSKYNHDERDRSNTKKYSGHKTNYLSDDCDISQKIKNLELEGLKLRSQVENILHETNEGSTSRTCESMNDCDSFNTDQNAVYEAHCSRDDLNRSFQKSFDSKQNNDHHTRDYKGLQKEVEECREKLDFMHQKLKQENYNHQREKDELLSSVENLKRINYKLKSNNDCEFQDLRSRERKHESMIDNLRSNLNQLLNVNKKQEEILAESGKRLIELESVPPALKAFDNLRDLLIDYEYHFGAKFIDDQDLESCSPEIMIDIIDKCFKEFNSDIDDRSRKIRQMEDEMVLLKRTLLHEKEKSMLELKNQLVFMEEQNNYLKRQINDINDNSNREISKMREETLILKSKMDSEMASATSVIDGLENNIQQMSNKLKKDNESWALEKKSLEKLFDESEKQLAIVRIERDQSINQKSSVLAKLDATQNKLSETETQLLQLQSDKYSLDQQIETLSKRNKAVENNLSCTRIYLENITKSIRQSSHRGDGFETNKNADSSNNMLFDAENSEEENVPWRPRKYEVEEILHQIKIMGKMKNESVEKFDQMKKEFEAMEKQLDVNKIENKRLEQTTKALQLEIESSKNENSHINSLISNRNGEIERLTAERDYYFQMLNEKTEDLANVKTEKHRLIVLLSTKVDIINSTFSELEERCRQLEIQSNVSNTNQNNDSQIIDISRGKNQILREERNRLAIQLNEMQNLRDELVTTQRDQNSCIEHMRSENVHLQAELKNLYQDYDEIVVENKRLLIKLKDSDIEIANLCQELQYLKGSKSKKHSSLEKKITDLNAELSSYRNELKISQGRIKSLEKAGSKSHQNSLPPSLHNEFNKPLPNTDSLQLTKSRLNVLEQQMTSMQSSHKNLREENVKLTDLLRKVTYQNDRMAEELETYVEENKHLRSRVGKKTVDDGDKKLVDKGDKKTKSSRYQTKDKYSIICPDNVRKSTNKAVESLKNNESISKLREDLQESIKEAKKLLSSKPLRNPNEDCLKPQESSSGSSKSTESKLESLDLNRKRSLSDHANSNHNNNSLDSNSKTNYHVTENTDSSTLNTKRSDVTSLTEVDGHLNLPQIRQNDQKNTGNRCSSPVEKLLSSDFKNDYPNCNQKKSYRNTVELEEKIKRLLTTES